MSARHPAEHEERLEDVLTGRDPAGEAELLRCPVCKPRLARLRRIAAGLDGAGVLERDLLALAPDHPPAPGEARLEATVRAALAPPRSDAPPAGRARPSRARRFGVAAVVGALAASVLAFLWGRRGAEGDALPPAEVYLGGEDLALVRPLGAVGAYDVFQWEHRDAPRRGSYVLRILDDTEEGRGEVVVELQGLRSTSWQPTEEARDWPVRIAWTVLALDATGGDAGSASASAWLSSPAPR